MLVGAHHPRGKFSEMRGLDVTLALPLRAFVSRKTSVTAVVEAAGLTPRVPASGVLSRSGLVVSLRLVFPVGAAEWALAVTSGRALSMRALTELRGSLGSSSAPEVARGAVLRLDVFRGPIQPGPDEML